VLTVGGSFEIGRLFGIPVRVHWLFLGLVAIFGVAGWMKGGPLPSGRLLSAVVSVVYIVALFACVVVHELAHSLVGRRFGVKVESITLLPIGGVAAMEEMPRRPSEELLMAIVGPITSLAIGAVIAGIIYAIRGPAGLLRPFDPLHGSLLSGLMWTNIVIAGFNLLPAFPMDGGRVLRAVLAHYMGQVQATQIAASLGQAVAVLLGLTGVLVWPNLWLVVIAIFIYIGAGQESQQVRMQAVLDGITARQAMISRFETINRSEPLSTALAYASQGYQADFPVVEGDTIVGLVTRQDLLTGLHHLGPAHTVGEIMTTNVCQAAPETTLGNLFRSVAQGTCGIVLVRENDRIIGLVTPESVRDRMMLAATGGRPAVG
jgi:Zn-dependent protease/CBS domain-containing protein